MEGKEEFDTDSCPTGAADKSGLFLSHVRIPIDGMMTERRVEMLRIWRMLWFRDLRGA